jgi:septation ring formation regulator EzrA
MIQITNELMYEILKSIQARLETMDKGLKDIAHGQIRLREDLNNFHRDTIRLEVQVSDVSNRLERLEKRFETVQIN